MKNTFKFFTLFLVILFAFGCEDSGNNKTSEGEKIEGSELEKPKPKAIVRSGLIKPRRLEDCNHEICIETNYENCFFVENDNEQDPIDYPIYCIGVSVENESNFSVEVTRTDLRFYTLGEPIAIGSASNFDTTTIQANENACIWVQFDTTEGFIFTDDNSVEVDLTLSGNDQEGILYSSPQIKACLLQD